MKPKDCKLAEVENIFFDFGNVLMDIDICKTIEAFKKLGIEKNDITNSNPNESGVFLDLELGKISVNQFCQTIRESAKRDSLTNKEILDAWESLITNYDYARFELIINLRKKGYKVFVLSNNNKPHHDKCEEIFDKENPFGENFKNLFDGVYYSDELGSRKPDADIYEKVRKLSGVDVTKSLFIDDHAPNLVTAKSLGWQTHHLVSPETILDIFE